MTIKTTKNTIVITANPGNPAAQHAAAAFNAAGLELIQAARGVLIFQR